jgi:hypothetical protein
MILASSDIDWLILLKALDFSYLGDSGLERGHESKEALSGLGEERLTLVIATGASTFSKLIANGNTAGPNASDLPSKARATASYGLSPPYRARDFSQKPRLTY